MAGVTPTEDWQIRGITLKCKLNTIFFYSQNKPEKTLQN
jgi:hypothetical protein